MADYVIGDPLRCTCEHEQHFDGSGHAYGVPLATGSVKTIYGTFRVCDECKTLHGWIKED